MQTVGFPDWKVDMPDNTVTAISPATPEAGSAYPLAASSPAAGAPAAPKEPAKAAAPKEAAQPAGATPLTDTADVSLRYRVDEKTNELTVFVIDRASRQVLRTIPADELKQLKAGDLFQLLA